MPLPPEFEHAVYCVNFFGITENVRFQHSILYEPIQNEVYTFNGKGKSATVFDPESGKVIAHH